MNRAEYTIGPRRLELEYEHCLPDWLPGFAQCLDQLLSLPENWDSYGAARISPAVVKPAVRVLLDHLPSQGAPPQVVPTNSGGLQFEWHEQSVDLEIEIFPVGEPVVYYFNRATDTEWEAPLSDCSAALKEVLHGFDEVWATSNR